MFRASFFENLFGKNNSSSLFLVKKHGSEDTLIFNGVAGL
jgi:hypothetical protein